MRAFILALVAACSPAPEAPVAVQAQVVAPEPPPSGCRACHGLCEWTYRGHVKDCTETECTCRFPDRSTVHVVWGQPVVSEELAKWGRPEGQIGIRHHYQDSITHEQQARFDAQRDQQDRLEQERARARAAKHSRRRKHRRHRKAR